MQGDEVDLAQHCSSTNDAFAVGEEVIAKNVDQGCGVSFCASGSDGGVQRRRESLPAVFFQDFDDSSRLYEVLAQISITLF